MLFRSTPEHRVWSSIITFIRVCLSQILPDISFFPQTYFLYDYFFLKAEKEYQEQFLEKNYSNSLGIWNWKRNMSSLNSENVFTVEEHPPPQFLICNTIQKIIPVNNDSKDHLTHPPTTNNIIVIFNTAESGTICLCFI